jgi:CIC family chloride channel protein
VKVDRNLVKVRSWWRRWVSGNPKAADGDDSLMPFAGRREDTRGFASRLRTLVRSNELFLALTAMIVGAVTGVLVTGMSQLAQAAHVLLFHIPLDFRLSASATIDPVVALAAPACGGLLLGLMEWWRRKRKIASAVDPVEANALRGGRMSMRDSFVVSGQTVISNGCGASVGLEAGYTQIGAGMASLLGVWLRFRRNDLRTLVGCGAAAAIAAAFNAPLTGAFYGFELIIGVYSVANAAIVMAATLTAVLMTRALGGSPYSLEVPPVAALHYQSYLALVALSLVSGLLAIAVMRAVGVMERAFELSRLPVWARPVVGGLIVGSLAILSPQVLAAGHGAMSLDIARDMTALAIVSIIGLKLAACLVSLSSGFRGGLFFASLFVGSLVGKLFALLLTTFVVGARIDPTASILAGMGTFGVAVVGGPLTMSFLVLESTSNFGLTVGVLAACISTSLAVRSIFGYSFSTWRFHLRGETIRSANDIGWIRNLSVGRLMRRDPSTIDESATIETFRKTYPLGSTQWVIVVDHENHYGGLLSVPVLHAADLDSQAKETQVKEVARQCDAMLTPAMNVKYAMTVFDEAEAEALVVVGGPDKDVVGLLMVAYATRRYAEELDQASRGVFGGE